jgi:hypothetical protein
MVPTVGWDEKVIWDCIRNQEAEDNRPEQMRIRVTFGLAVHNRVQGLQLLIGAVFGLAIPAAAVLKI